jgi:hypothetical protein
MFCPYSAEVSGTGQSVMTKHDLIRQTLSLSKGLGGDFNTLDLRPAPLKFAAQYLQRPCLG